MPYFADIAAAIAANRDTLRATGALAARPGRKLDPDGYPTDFRVIVLFKPAAHALTEVPAEIAGFPVDVRAASPLQELRFTKPVAFARQAARSRPEFVPASFPGEVNLQFEVDAASDENAKPTLAYTAPDGANLDPLPARTVKMICSVSPDNGWDVLQTFLMGTQTELTVAMYDCTSAHIEQTLAMALSGKTFELVLDNPSKNPTADQTDAQTVGLLTTSLGTTFQQQWALTPRDPDGGTPIFPSAYHIKVAVRDTGSANSAVWLSSGNWNNSNQPVFDLKNPNLTLAAKSDRDWHVVLFDDDLATTFKKYLEHDFAVAKEQNDGAKGQVLAGSSFVISDDVETAAFTDFVDALSIEDEMAITPLLTPDPGIYVDRITRLFDAATSSIDLQMQYVTSFAAAGNEAFDNLIHSLAAAETRGVAIRMIFSEYQQESILELLREAGLAIDRDHVRIQNNVHNKGMLVDGTTTVVSSQNWSGDGVLRNRDAGLIIVNEQINAYFSARFDYDWNTLATAKPEASRSKADFDVCDS